MSLLRREHVRVGIGASRIDVVRTSRGWKSPAALRHSVEYTTAPGESRSDAISVALRSALGAGRGTCSIVLSNTHVRYATLPWHAEIAPAARAAYARAQLVNTYGAVAATWALILDESSYGRPAGVCALDASLLDAVRRSTLACGYTLQSLQPYFAAAFNRCRRRMREREFWFAVAEPERLCLACVTDGAISRLQAQRVTRDPGSDLAAMLARETLVGSNEPDTARLYVFAPCLPPDALTALAEIDAFRFEAHPYLAPVGGDTRYALALA